MKVKDVIKLLGHYDPEAVLLLECSSGSKDVVKGARKAVGFRLSNGELLAVTNEHFAKTARGQSCEGVVSLPWKEGG